MDKQEMRDRLEALPKYIQRWLLVERNQVQEGVIQTVLDAFRAVESPEPREGVETGLDFLGVLKEEGSNNGLWQLSMDLLDSEISSAVAALYEDDQVALLLPWVDDLDGFGTDQDAKDWAMILRQRCDDPRDHDQQVVNARAGLAKKIDFSCLFSTFIGTFARTGIAQNIVISRHSY